MAIKTVTRIFFVFIFLVISCSSSESKYQDDDDDDAPLVWKFGHAAFERAFQRVLRILKAMSRLFPITHELIGHWRSNLITILHDITSLAREGNDHHQELAHHGQDSGQYQGSYHHIWYHHYSGNPRGAKHGLIAFDVISTLFKNNVGHLGFEAMTPVQSLVKHLYKFFFGNILHLGHFPGFPDIVENVINVSRFDSPGELIHPLHNRHLRDAFSSSSPSSSSSSSSGSSSAASSSESSSEELIPGDFLKKISDVVSENNPVTNPSKLLSIAKSVSSSNIFKDLMSAYQRITGKDVEALGPILRVTQVTEWIQKTILPAFMQFSNLLNVPVPLFDLQSFWIWPFKIMKTFI